MENIGAGVRKSWSINKHMVLTKMDVISHNLEVLCPELWRTYSKDRPWLHRNSTRITEKQLRLERNNIEERLCSRTDI